MWCLARYVWNSKIKARTTYNHSFNGSCFNFRESAISQHYSTKMPLKACYLQDEEKAKDLWETHTKHNTAPTNSVITESIRKMNILSEEHWQNLEKRFYIADDNAKRGYLYREILCNIFLNPFSRRQ